MMAAPEFDATGFVRPVLHTIALCFSSIVISSMTMIKPAQASGTVNPSVLYWGGNSASGYNCAGLTSLVAVQSCELAWDGPFLSSAFIWFNKLANTTKH